jgi:hypothetical protein
LKHFFGRRFEPDFWESTMATETPVVNNKQSVAAPKTPQAPPAGAFWKRYSPHHELPLSLSSSFFLHVLGFVLLGGFLLTFLGLNRDKGIEVDAIRVSGGGGNKEGIGSNPGDGVLPSNEAITDKPQAEAVTTNTNPEKLVKPEVKPPEITLPDTGRPVEPNTTAAQTNLSAAGKKAREKLAGALAGKGQGGPGSGGGQGSGTGTGIGNASGPGHGTLNQREKRQLRWTMIFNTRSGEDYADQLLGLGAILAILGPNGEYLVIRDLDRRHRPVQAKPEDIKELNRIYWVDDKPQSVNSLAMALGIRPVPDHIVAFFPQQLEKELAEKELQHLRSRSRGTEDDIAETVFRVERRGNRYEPVVIDQKRK